MNEEPGPWQLMARHEATGREARWRVETWKMHGHNELKVSVSCEAYEADGTPLGSLSHNMDWENSTIIKGSFNEDGTELSFRANWELDLNETLVLQPYSPPPAD